MRHISLFTGIGGFELAAQRVWGDEYEPVLFCEMDKFCQKVLKKHWPEVPIEEDVRNVGIVTNATSERLPKRERQAGKISEARKRSEPKNSSRRNGNIGIVDLITGGFPCQPFSQAGKRDGRSDNRYLWPEMLRVIRAFKPAWVVAENVRGLLSIEDGVVFEQVCTDLEDAGYEVQPFVIPAVAVDAHHRRDRVWFVAYSGADGRRGRNKSERGRCDRRGGSEWLPEPDVGRVANGVPNRVDRLKSLGNAIVPQVAEQIFRAVKEVNQ